MFQLIMFGFDSHTRLIRPRSSCGPPAGLTSGGLFSGPMASKCRVAATLGAGRYHQSLDVESMVS